MFDLSCTKCLIIVEYKFFIIKCVFVCFLMKHLVSKCSIVCVLRGKSVILVCCLPGDSIAYSRQPMHVYSVKSQLHLEKEQEGT